jgi:hypothetical protein
MMFRTGKAAMTSSPFATKSSSSSKSDFAKAAGNVGYRGTNLFAGERHAMQATRH